MTIFPNQSRNVLSTSLYNKDDNDDDDDDHHHNFCNTNKYCISSASKLRNGTRNSTGNS